MSRVTIKNKESIEIIRIGMQGDFWKLIVQAMEESRERLREEQDGEEMESLPPEQYKFEMALIRAKIRFLNKLMDSPAAIMEWLGSPDNTNKNFDPYE